MNNFLDSINTIFIIAITSIISILAFNNYELFDKLKFNAYMIWHKKEWGRMFSNALIHSGWFHLIINMYVLYIFGGAVENAFQNSSFFPETYKYGRFLYFLMYLLAIPFSSGIALLRYKNIHSYNAVGASGAVSAIAFTFILLAPKAPLSLLFIPIEFPAYVFGIAYLIYSYVMSKRGNDNIAHEAHFAGAIFGITFPIILNYNILGYFISQII